ncbi:ATP12 family chaperone protein [Rhizobium halophytocola]|uniref:Chaperone required for assembly of F1-ATPase n=1 Tax=Rhizobium halophytocola TaxID=735519 RepID=A0ABS4DZI4_9HYPH|nr:ATP12 family protein [Rhizobium halophytocola]MBP1851095.1 chaperone required for assembly of F1-ATPase [Rhizobium halophytocola]
MRDELSGIFTPEQSHEDPVRRAQIQMHRPLPKRFYTDVTVEPEDQGFAVKLDGKPVKTPGRNPLQLRTPALAGLVADEWRAQVDVINPATMPITKLSNTAIDAVSQQLDAVAEEILNFAGTDALFYRADTPQELVARQNAAWNPIIEWAAADLGARFILAEGVVHRQQPAESLAAFAAALSRHHEPFSLSSLHVMTTLTGSALLALAVAEGRLTTEEAWALAHVDEDWTEEHWGFDAEAQARRQKRFEEMQAAAQLFHAHRGRD